MIQAKDRIEGFELQITELKSSWTTKMVSIYICEENGYL